MILHNFFHRDVSFIIKLTNECNLNCPYCYHFHNNSRESYKLNMKMENIELAIRRLIEYNRHNAHFIWHGGEPLLRDIHIFQYIIETQKKYCKSFMNISNSIQTNGTLLKEDWINFFIENNFHIGISIDGYRELHTKNRNIDTSIFDVLMEKIKILNARKARFGILTVVSKSTISHEKELLQFFILSNINNVGFLPATVVTDDIIDWENTITPEEYGKFLINFFDAWVQCGKTGMSFREYDEYFRGKMKIQHRLCVNSNECERYFTITPEGKIFLCDCFPMGKETYIGDISNPLKEMLKSNENLTIFRQHYAQTPSLCKNCPHKKICNGGCKYHRWLVDKGMKKPHLYCKSYKMLYEHMDNVIGKI